MYMGCPDVLSPFPSVGRRRKRATTTCSSLISTDDTLTTSVLQKICNFDNSLSVDFSNSIPLMVDFVKNARQSYAQVFSTYLTTTRTQTTTNPNQNERKFSWIVGVSHMYSNTKGYEICNIGNTAQNLFLTNDKRVRVSGTGTQYYLSTQNKSIKEIKTFFFQQIVKRVRSLDLWAFIPSLYCPFIEYLILIGLTLAVIFFQINNIFESLIGII